MPKYALIELDGDKVYCKVLVLATRFKMEKVEVIFGRTWEVKAVAAYAGDVLRIIEEIRQEKP